jgi:hypothetical protein
MASILPRTSELESLPTHKDTSLLPDEDPNLTNEILNTVGEDWMYVKNVWLGNRAPRDLIGTPDEFHVRALLRSIKVAALS